VDPWNLHARARICVSGWAINHALCQQLLHM
jgi:hypothetical protein